MSDSADFIIPPPSAERYFNIARGDLGEGTDTPNSPEAVTSFALLSIAKSLMDIRDLLERMQEPPAKESAF